MIAVQAAATQAPLPFALSAGRYVVTARAGDRILQPARARLIWAANTASATAALGIPTLLVGGPSAFPYGVENPAGKAAARRELERLYGVEGGFDIALLQDPKAPRGQDWIAGGQFIRQVLPEAGLVHTRDPAIALECARRKIDWIYEEHDEDYQVGFASQVGPFLQQPSCRAIVAITEPVARRLRAEGVPANRLLILDSGVSRAALHRREEAAERWRAAFLRPCYRHLAAYAGGLHDERGIEHILRAAALLPHVMFVLAGGSITDQARWSHAIEERGIGNLKLIGYQDHDAACTLQQAADVVLATRAPGPRAAITSPLKLYEYLLSGTPFVTAEISATAHVRSAGLAGLAYDPAAPDALAAAIATAFGRFPRRPGGYAQNIEAGLAFTWEERQRRLLSFVGPVLVRETF
ncbi:glycosyltransferase family 4 protein [Roseomonas eburnea]|uniref:Glycosyltransferase family 4 protein n=1 Tax=Neoroseomonas eburnea TaxID=1346889 RepID=A0A9X9XC73_9PROT|nr:glycosyltransferase [Neoroseomonas eburnea]MBR0681309.1 glycosyltransferase family 4 protein [Neoroseomonas eburnea]